MGSKNSKGAGSTVTARLSRPLPDGFRWAVPADARFGTLVYSAPIHRTVSNTGTPYILLYEIAGTTREVIWKAIRVGPGTVQPQFMEIRISPTTSWMIKEEEESI